MTVSPAWKCPTCHTEVVTPFCSQCGERLLQPHDLTLRGLFRRLAVALTSIDSRLLRTVWCLLRNPGALTLAYAEGRRKPYVAPLQLFLAANVLFFAIQSLSTPIIFGATLESHLYHQDWGALAQSLVAKHLEQTQSSLALYTPIFDRAVMLNAKSLIILMTVPFAMFLPLVFLRSKQSFVVHAVFSLHLYTFLLLLFSVVLLISALDVQLGGAGFNSARMDNVLSVVNLAVCAVYLYFAVGPVYEATGAMRTAKVFVLALFAGAIVVGYRFLLFLITLYGT